METKIQVETAKLAKEKGFSLFNKDTKSAIVDTRNNRTQRFSFYVDTTKQDFCELYNDTIKREVTLKEDIGTNSSELSGLIPYYEGKVTANIHYYLAPTQALLQKWLRDVHKIDIYVLGYGFGYYSQLNNVPTANQGEIEYRDRRWNRPPEEKNSGQRTYEEALEVGLQQALKLIP